MLKAGFCEIDITPLLGMNIPGYFHKRPASGVKDPLFAKAFAIDDGEKALMLIVVDILKISLEIAVRIKERISAAAGIPDSHIVVSATHTHTGGPVGIFSEDREDLNYSDMIVNKAADAAVIAFSRREPVRIGFGLGEEKDISFIRRYFMKDGSYKTNPARNDPNIDRPDGNIDPDVTVMRIDDLAGNPKAVITNFACHQDTVTGTEISADYAGEISRTIKSVLGQDVVSIFIYGSSGNINHFDPLGKVAKPRVYYKTMGRVLAFEALKVREKTGITMTDEASLDARLTSFDAGVLLPSDEEVKASRKIVAEAGENTETVGEATAEAMKKSGKTSAYELHFAKEIVKLIENNITSIHIPIQVFRIGEMAITALPGETFTEFGLEIKSKSPFKYNMISSLANAGVGYVPTRDAYARGGYEPKITSSGKVAPGTGEKLCEEALKLLALVWGNGA